VNTMVRQPRAKCLVEPPRSYPRCISSLRRGGLPPRRSRSEPAGAPTLAGSLIDSTASAPYLWAMSKRPSSRRTTAELPRWQISRIKAAPAADVGTVQAADAEAAIRTAIEQFGIKNPQHQQRLVARRIGQ
jgi:hypothetical protein